MRGTVFPIVIFVCLLTLGNFFIFTPNSSSIASSTLSNSLLINLQDILSEGQFVFGPNANSFDIHEYLGKINSPLLQYADLIEEECAYASVNPRVVLTLIEMQSGLVTGKLKNYYPNETAKETLEPVSYTHLTLPTIYSV